MLQRAAGNAYSWWWASHIRTKQSKWLEQSLADMEEKVNETLKIVAHDGDSFAKRAEMYYRRRPEIIGFVEESFKAYRSLAEKYDHLSRELQSANRTISQVFPERAQFAMDEEDEAAPETPRSARKALKTPRKDMRSPSMMRKGSSGQLKRSCTSAGFVAMQSSGLSKAEALEEIDKLQKAILGLQTEKEFVRNEYENAATKYWDMENQISEMQAKVTSLQDEYGVGTIIEDSEARSLMATSALKSCKQTLQKLQEKHKQTSEDAKTEDTRIKEAYYQFEALKEEFLTKYLGHQKECIEKSNTESTSPDSSNFKQKVSSQMIKENIVPSSNTDLSVIEMSEKIDELVTKVVKLETLVTSQEALVKRLTSETDEFKRHIQELGREKENLTQSSEIMRKKIEELEDELCRVRSLNQTVEDQNTKIQTQFVEASGNIEDLSKQMHTVKLDEDLENAELFKVKEAPNTSVDKETNKLEGMKLAARDNSKTTEVETPEDETKKDGVPVSGDSENLPEVTQQKDLSKDSSGREDRDVAREEDERKINDVSVSGVSENSPERTQQKDPSEEDLEEEAVPAWRLLYLNTLDDRERNLLEDYSSVLQNYKDVRRKLNDVEERNRESLHDLTIQVRELVKSNTMRDAEIQALRQQLDTQQSNEEDHSPISSPGYYYSPLQSTSESTSKVDGSPVSTISLAMESSTQDVNNDELNVSTSLTDIPIEEKENGIEVNHIGECKAISTSEEKIQREIDELLEDNLEFWLRFSNSIQQKRKFQATIQDLKAELSRLKVKNKHLSSGAKPIYRHLREIHTELKLWLEQSAVLKVEMQSRFSSVSHLQGEITEACSGAGKMENMELTENQAAKFHGEVLNMKQENTMIEDELQMGLERVKALQLEVENLLEKLDAELGMSSPKGAPQPSRSRIPLRSFLFGVKLKKKRQKHSLLSCVSPSQQYLGSPTPRLP